LNTLCLGYVVRGSWVFCMNICMYLLGGQVTSNFWYLFSTDGLVLNLFWWVLKGSDDGV
jgi:hypothetical protein